MKFVVAHATRLQAITNFPPDTWTRLEKEREITVASFVSGGAKTIDVIFPTAVSRPNQTLRSSRDMERYVDSVLAEVVLSLSF